jgi:large subunit ribosomal protein L9
MELILLKNVDKLGERGAIVKVAPGYARNYLIPQGLGTPVTAKNRAALEAEVERAGRREERLRAGAEEAAAKFVDVSLRFEKLCNESGELYGSVTAAEVAEALAERGFEVDKKQVLFDETPSHIGIFAAHIKFAEGVEAPVSITVVKPEE